MFWVISVYFNVRNIPPKSGTFPLDTLYIAFREAEGKLAVSYKFEKSAAVSDVLLTVY